MLKSIAAGIAIFITGLFGAHSAQPAIQGQLTAAAVSAVDVAPQSIALASASPFDPPATTTCHAGYVASQRIRKRIEEAFGWIKTVGGMRRPMLRGTDRVGWAFTFAAAAYNLIRLPRLMGIAA